MHEITFGFSNIPPKITPLEDRNTDVPFSDPGCFIIITDLTLKVSITILLTLIWIRVKIFYHCNRF